MYKEIKLVAVSFDIKIRAFCNSVLTKHNAAVTKSEGKLLISVVAKILHEQFMIFFVD